MSVTIHGIYAGGLATEMRHEPSSATIRTDPPVDNGGEGRSFSPTDLVATGLGSCVMSILALMAQRDKINLQGMAVRVDKHMSADAPRRICQLDVHLTLPAHLDAATRLKLERAAHTCPVAKSIHPDIALNIETTYR